MASSRMSKGVKAVSSAQKPTSGFWSFSEPQQVSISRPFPALLTHIDDQASIFVFVQLVLTFLLSDLPPHLPDRQHVVCLGETIQTDDDRGSRI